MLFVYRIDCKDCEKMYIGQTEQYYLLRKWCITLMTKNAHMNHQKTVLGDHSFTTGHTFDFGNYKILNTETNLQKRLFLEMVNIVQDKNSINSATEDIDKMRCR